MPRSYLFQHPIQFYKKQNNHSGNTRTNKILHPVIVVIILISVSKRRVSPIASTFDFVLAIPLRVCLHLFPDPAYHWRFLLAASKVFGEVISKITSLFANRIVQRSASKVAKAFLEVLDVFLV